MPYYNVRYKSRPGNYDGDPIFSREVHADGVYDAMNELKEEVGDCYIVSVSQNGKTLFDNASNYHVSGPG